MADAEETISFIIYIIGLVCGLIACFLMVLFIIRHAYWMYQDLYTDERKSVAHRRNPPERTSLYKWVNWWSLAVMIFGAGYSYGIVALYFADDIIECRSLYASAIPCGGLSRFAVFVVYIIRLHMVYKGSQYEFKIPHLKVTIIGILIVYVIALAPMTVYSAATNDRRKVGKFKERDYFTGLQWRLELENEDWYYNVCELVIPLVYMGFFAMIDFVVNAGFMYVFIKPIKEVIQKVQGSTRNINEKSKTSKKMLFIGFKVALLCVVLFISSLLANGLYTLFQLNLYPVDLLINTICIAFMTQYYPDKDYYQVYCKLCIKCCDKKGYTSGKGGDELVPPHSPDAEAGRTELTVTDIVGSKMDSNALSSGSDNISNNGPSVDTISQVRIAAKEQAPLNRITDEQETELAAHLSPNA